MFFLRRQISAAASVDVRSHSCELSELAHEILLIIVSALICDRIHIKSSSKQKIFCIGYSAADYILTKADAEYIFIRGTEVTVAYEKITADRFGVPSS